MTTSRGKFVLRPAQTVWVHLILAVLILVGFVGFAQRYVGHVLTIRNVDYFQFVDMGYATRIGGLAAWVNGLHPIGYPLLIRLGIALGFNATQIGHTLSVIGGIFLLISAYALTYRLTKERWLALFSELFLATTGWFLFYGTLEGNDMLSAGLIGLSLVLLLERPKHWRVYLAAGLLAGLSYIIRYTAVATSAICLLHLVGLAVFSKRRENWKYVGSFAGGWIVGAALQLIPSLLVTGNPLYSIQGHNVWWHVTGLSNFVTEWRLAPMDVSLLQVFWAEPQRFLGHWWRIFRSFWVSPDLLLLDTPLRLFTQAALLFTLIAGRKLSGYSRGLLAVFVGGLLAGLAIIRYDPRFMLVLLPILVFCVVYFFYILIPKHVQFRGWSLPTGYLFLGMLGAWALFNPINIIKEGPQTSETIVQVSNVLRAAGIHAPNEVLSANIHFHDMTMPEQLRYSQSYWVAPEMNSLEALHQVAREQHFRFMIYDVNVGKDAHPGLLDLLNPGSRPAGLTPLLSAGYVVYRIEPSPPQPEHDRAARWEDGIVLRGYDLYVTPEATAANHVRRIGLFLYWEPTQPISQSYKVFVHILDQDGNLAAQADGIPAIWTHSTQNWQPGEIVVDFHTCVLTNPVQAVYQIYVGLYDEQHPEQRLRLLPGQNADDSLKLTILDLSGEKQ